MAVPPVMMLPKKMIKATMVVLLLLMMMMPKERSPKSTTVSAVGSSKCPIDSTPRSHSCSTKYLNILIVDDAISNRKLLHRLLSAKGFTCHQAVDGLDALRVYEEVTRQHREQLQSSQGMDTNETIAVEAGGGDGGGSGGAV